MQHLDIVALTILVLTIAFSAGAVVARIRNVERLLEALQQEMHAAANKHDQATELLHRRISKLDDKVDERMQVVGERIEKIDKRVVRLEEKVAG